MAHPQHIQMSKIDHSLLDMQIGNSNVVLVRVSRRTDIDDYISAKMQTLREREKDLVIEYKALTGSQEREFKHKHAPLFYNQDPDAPESKKILFVYEPLYFHATLIRDLFLSHNYRKIFLFTSKPPQTDDVIIQMLSQTDCLFLDAVVNPEPMVLVI